MSKVWEVYDTFSRRTVIRSRDEWDMRRKLDEMNGPHTNNPYEMREVEETWVFVGNKRP